MSFSAAVIRAGLTTGVVLAPLALALRAAESAFCLCTAGEGKKEEAAVGGEGLN